MYACLVVPMPPSMNALYGTNWKTKKRFNSKRYENWIRDAGIALLQQETPVIEGNYTLKLSFGPRRGDLGNRGEKAVSDLLEKHGVIENDKLADRIILEWDNNVIGCQIEIEQNIPIKARAVT